MANKSRPKKTRGAFFKKYSYGQAGIGGEELEEDLYRPAKELEGGLDKDSLFLPYEIILKIIHMTPNPYILNHLLVCRDLYWDLVVPKYSFPAVKTGNLNSFLDTICGDNAACVGTDDNGIIGIGMEGNSLVSNLQAEDSSDDDEDYGIIDEENDLDQAEQVSKGNKKKKQSYKDIKKKTAKPKGKRKANVEVKTVVETNNKAKFLPKTYLKHKFNNMVNTLDMSQIVQSGKNSFVSKLLRRTSESLEVYIASQSSFGTAPLIALKSCARLKVLDLRLVSESVNLFELFKAIEKLPELEQLCFPRSSVICESFDFVWPKKLWYLRLQGGVTDEFASKVQFPSTITKLELAHCPHLTNTGLDAILMKIGFGLTSLSITYPMPKLGEDGADRSFWYCPELRKFTVDVAYISWELFSEDLLVELEEGYRPLRHLQIESTGYMGMCSKITPNDITIAVDEERLPSLRSITLSAMLGWDFKGQEMEDLLSEMDHHGIDVFKI